jgi:hypothetical protein
MQMTYPIQVNNANDLPVTEVLQIGRIVETMSSILESNPESVKRLIIPIVEQYHFFVLCVDVSFNAPKFIVRARFYDSLKRRTRRVNQSTTAANIVTEVNKFFVTLYSKTRDTKRNRCLI